MEYFLTVKWIFAQLLFLADKYDIMNTCPAVKATGEVCGARCRDHPRCGTHMKTLENNGPHATAQKELGYRHRAAVRQLIEARNPAIEEETDVTRKERMEQDLNHDVNVLRLAHRREMDTLIREQEDEVRQTGVDPDARARQRREEVNRQRQEINRLRWEQRFEERRIAREAAAQEIVNQIRGVHAVNAIVDQLQNIAGQQQAAPRGELQRFAADNQNVHTTVAVRQTKDMVQKLLAIPVPPEFRWNMRECSKTPGDIIMCCKLTPKGGWQMVAKYCQDENIYELGQGIYGKVLDGVWQYILRSPDKEDLCKIMKQEMEDNIGMCAQGNLTRLCNILAGYMDGIGPQESPAEVLGRKLPLLMEIENDDEKLEAAYRLFVELNIPENEWIDWAQPLVNSRIKLRSNAVGHVLGFMVY